MKKSLLLTILLLSGISFASGDTIYMKDGLTIEGKILEINPLKDIVISTPDGRKFTYPISSISRIALSDADRPNPTPTADQPAPTSPQHPEKSGQLPNEPLPPAADQPDPASPQHPEKPGQLSNKPLPPVADQPRPEKRHIIATQPPQHREPLILEPQNQHIPQPGYHGYVSTNSAIFFPDYLQIGFSTTHGIQIHPNLFIGGGFALNFVEDKNGGEIYMPIYTELRTNLGENLAQFSAGTRIGLSISNDIGFYWYLDAGLRLGFSPKFALHITPFVELQPLSSSEYVYNTLSSSYLYTYKWILTCATGLRIGFEF